MTIDRTKVKPNYYIEIDSIDYSDVVVGDGYFEKNTKQKISSGRFNLYNTTGIKKYKEVAIYVQYDSKVKKFGGVISNTTEDVENKTLAVDIKNFSWLAYQTDYTGVFRADAGKGNIKTIMTDILLEKFPNATWTDESFPDITDTDKDILYKMFYNQKVGDIYDKLVENIARDWWFDENQVLYCKERIYTEIDEPVVFGDNIIGLPLIEVNNNYANIVKVYGSTFENDDKYIYSGTGDRDEFLLDFYPAGNITTEYSDGTRISTTQEGQEDYNDPDKYDAYFKVSDKKLQFNVPTVSATDNIIIKTKVYNSVYEEVGNASEINRIGAEVVKEIRNDDIATPEEAYLIGDEYLKQYSQDQYIFSIPVEIGSDDNITNWSIGNAVKINLGTGLSDYENIVQENWRWNKTQNLFLTLRFVDFKRTDNNILQDLINKIRNQQSKIDNSTSGITKYLYIGASLVAVIQNVSIKTQATDDRFEMQSVNQDVRSFMSRTGTISSGTFVGQAAAIMRRGTYETDETIIYSENAVDTFIELFNDDWFISPTSTGTLNETVYTVVNNAFLLEENIFKNKKRYNKGIINITGTLNEVTIAISDDNFTTSQSLSNGDEFTLNPNNTETNGISLKIGSETSLSGFPTPFGSWGVVPPLAIMEKIKIKCFEE